MAKSEHQGLQIALILFVMMTVVLAITTFVYYRQSEESAKAEEDAKKKAEAANTRANDFQARVGYVLHILGQATLPEAEVEQLKQSFGSDEEMKGVIDSFETFVNSFGAGMPKDKLNYAGVAPEVLNGLRDRNNSLLQQTAEASKLAKELETTRATEAQRTQTAIKGQQDAERTLADEIQKYENDRDMLKLKQETQLASFNAELGKRKSEVDSLKAEEDRLAKEVAKRESVISDQAKTIENLRDEPFEVPDGQITWVNQGASTVWINLGLADGLRRQTMFSVYDQADNGVTRSERKASVEVTRVLGQHFAEARIITDIPANPIMMGDQIFSPAWRPGKRVRFALVGIIDIDGDRRSDRNLVRSLLAASGGQIDAEMHDDGQVEGEMSAGTRYLVLGETPDDRSDPKVLAAYSTMKKQAEELGVETIPVDKMLDWLGYHPEARSVGLGANALPSQWTPQPAGGKSPSVPNSAFEQRWPKDKSSAGSRGAASKK